MPTKQQDKPDTGLQEQRRLHRDALIAGHVLRALGRPEATFLVERIIDVAAQKLKMDPAEIRRKNFPQPDEFPFKTSGGVFYDSANYQAALDKALELGAVALPPDVLNTVEDAATASVMAKIWDGVEAALSHAYNQGIGAAREYIQQVHEQLAALATTAAHRADAVRQAIMSRLSVYLKQVIDTALDSVRPSIVVGGSALAVAPEEAQHIQTYATQSNRDLSVSRANATRCLPNAKRTELAWASTAEPRARSQNSECRKTNQTF